jgi:hypothetical protein
MSMNPALLVLAAALVAVRAPAAESDAPPRPALVPRPVQVEWRLGHFEIGPRTVIAARGEAGKEADLLAQALRSSTGQRLRVVQRSRRATASSW